MSSSKTLNDPESNAPDETSVSMDPAWLAANQSALEEMVRDTIRKDPKWVSDTILPGLGPAIRKTVADSFRHLIEQVNDAMDYSLSREGIKWRIEAARSGRSFAEIVLYNTLIYRVEQVLLIHRKTGLLLHHVSADEEGESHADLVSSMLTAIQDFARDAFDAAEGDVLKTMEVGELKVWIHGGPNVLLAAVIRGNTPRDFRTRLDKTLEDVQLGFASALASFKGDVSTFDATRPLLNSCLLEERRKPRKSLPMLIALLVLLGAGFTTMATLEIRDRMRWSRYVESLDQVPGVVVSEVYRRGNQYSLTGLRDPLSGDPLIPLIEAGLSTNRISFKWETYNALGDEFILARAYEALSPPETVLLSLVDGRLAAQGSAPREWIREARLLAKALPGVSNFDDRELIDLDTSEFEILIWEFKEKSFRATREQIEAMVVDFSPSRSARDTKLKDDVQTLRDLIIKLGGLARFLNKDISVEVVALLGGSSDAKHAMRAAGESANGLKESLIRGGVKDIKMSSKVVRTQARYEQHSPTVVRVVDLSDLE